jgi:threonine/homoserine/homoserine lactone efflux protein
VTAFRPASLPAPAGSLLVAVTMMLVILPTAAIWAAGGRTLSRLVEGEAQRRAVGAVLALLLVASIVAVWL